MSIYGGQIGQWGSIRGEDEDRRAWQQGYFLGVSQQVLGNVVLGGRDVGGSSSGEIV